MATKRTADLAVPASMVVVGSLAATVATDVLKNNVYDVPMQGGDSLYPLAVVVLLMTMFGRSSTIRYVSLGMVSSSVTTIAESYGLV